MADDGMTLHAACIGSDDMTTNARRQLKLGAYISPGGHQGGWRHPDAVPNALICEFVAQEGTGLRDLLTRQSFVAQSGYISIPNEPGVGVELDESALAKYRVS